MLSFERYFDRSRGINKIALGTFSSYLFIVILHVLSFLILTAKSEINSSRLTQMAGQMGSGHHETQHNDTQHNI